MKVIIPVAGIGSKLRPHTHTQPKALVPVAGKPILGHIIDNLIDGGIKDFILIIGYLGSKIQSFIYSNYENNGVNINFVIQQPREGIGHAVYSARNYLNDEKEVLIMLGDTILDLDLKRFIASEASILGVMKVDNPGDFGVAELNKNGYVKKLVEKPKIPKSNLALVGIYKINKPPLLIDSIEYIIKNNLKNLGEYQLTEALMQMVNKGEKMVTMTVDNWYDCGKKDSLLAANAILLGRPEFKKTIPYKFSKTIIIPPVSIGQNCKISNSLIGPNVAIGENTILSYAIVKDTIVGSFSELQSVVLNNSIIGNDTSLKGLSQSLNIGDNTEINFSS
ncbi:sugar phosphate nucleotidyltransferase [soil metagenome]